MHSIVPVLAPKFEMADEGMLLSLYIQLENGWETERQ